MCACHCGGDVTLAADTPDLQSLRVTSVFTTAVSSGHFLLITTVSDLKGRLGRLTGQDVAVAVFGLVVGMVGAVGGHPHVHGARLNVLETRTHILFICSLSAGRFLQITADSNLHFASHNLPSLQHRLGGLQFV